MTETKEHNIPPLVARWFHAIDSPILDPIAVRKAKREKSQSIFTSQSTVQSSRSSIRSNSTVSTSSITPSTIATTPKASPKNWVPFSKRDNAALEKAYQGKITNIVPVNEDHLFEVDISKRQISPVFWEGPVFEVRRATWFMQSDGSKWLPCEENMSRQVEQGYHKHQPYVKPVITETELDLGTHPPQLKQTTSEKNLLSDQAISNNETDKKEPAETKQLEEIQVEEKEYLLGPYLGQYIVYTGPSQAWLLYDTTSAKIAKTFFTKISNNQNLGGTKMLRGYYEVEKETRKKDEAEEAKKKASNQQTKVEDDIIEKEVKVTLNRQIHEGLEEDKPRLSTDSADLSKKSRAISPQKKKELEEKEMTKHHAEDYENEESEEEVRNIDQIVFVIHGIGQQMSERLGQNFVHDVNVLRKTIKSTWPITVSGTGPLDRPNGIQVLPILWRKEILFGTDDTEEKHGLESDMGMPDGDDGCPTLDEITLDGAPNIRTLVADVFLDIPLYMTSKYHDQMIHTVSKEVNRVYKLFIERNPNFLANKGQVNLVAHSLGSLLAFDILTAQPFSQRQLTNVINPSSCSDKKSSCSLDFPVRNYFALGSPLGMIMLLRGNKMISRKALESTTSTTNTSTFNDKTAPVSFVYPAADNIYNIFHKSDPVAYRLEPLVVRHYGAKLKPVAIPYIKGGLKSVLDAGFNVGNDIANKAGAMFESFKSGLTGSLLMRGLGFSKPLEEAYPGAEMQWRSQTDTALMESRAAAKCAAKLKQFNPSGRLDFYLQEGLLENAYISALSVHMSYWQDVDVAGFLIREIYKNAQEKKNNPNTILV